MAGVSPRFMSSDSQQLRAFVLMPFGEADLQVYRDAIKPACEDAGLICERADEQVFTESVVVHVYQQIVAADLVIAEVSRPNANVYYETGFARAFGKRLLLLTRSADEIPFDLEHYPHIVYADDLVRLRETLRDRVRKLIEQRGTGATLTAVGFPWPGLVRRGMAALEEVERHFHAVEDDVMKLAADLPRIAVSLGVRKAPDIQISVVSGERVVLYHEYEPLIGGPALHVGMDRQNIYDEVFRHRDGTVAWADTIGNLERPPRLRTNLALFRSLGASGARVIVELHDELR